MNDIKLEIRTDNDFCKETEKVTELWKRKTGQTPSETDPGKLYQWLLQLTKSRGYCDAVLWQWFAKYRPAPKLTKEERIRHAAEEECMEMCCKCWEIHLSRKYSITFPGNMFGVSSEEAEKIYRRRLHESETTEGEAAKRKFYEDFHRDWFDREANEQAEAEGLRAFRKETRERKNRKERGH